MVNYGIYVLYMLFYKQVSTSWPGSYMLKTAMNQGLAYAYDMLKSKLSQGLGNVCRGEIFIDNQKL